MKTQKLKFAILAFGSVLFTSCTSLLYTSIDVLRPAKVEFAMDANNLLIVNNSVKQPANMGHKTELYNEPAKNIHLATDSLSIFCLGALTEEIESRDFFSSVQLVPNSVNKTHDFLRSRELTPQQVKNLCASYHSNVVLSLDKIKVNDNLMESYLDESSSFLGSLELQFETYWSIHYLDRPEVKTIQFNDTVSWESESYRRKKAFSDLPKRADALIDGALNVGHKSVDQFIPHWEKADRYFYNSRNKLMKQAMDSVYIKNWKAAISLWQTAISKNGNAKIKSQAANNIAIAYEITGDLNKALQYAQNSLLFMGEMTAVDYNSFRRLSDYISDLTLRKKEAIALNKQLGN